MKIKLTTIAALSLFILSSCAGTEETETTTSDLDLGTDQTEETQVETNSVVKDLNNEDFAAFLESNPGQLIDVRTPEEFEVGHIENAVNINFYSDDFESQIEALDPSIPTFVYCQAGGRSGQARDLLVEKNFSEIYNLKDGFGNWEK